MRRGLAAVAPGWRRDVDCAAELPRSDRAALARVRRGFDSTEATFRDALIRAKSRGELPKGADVNALARFLMCGFQGLRLVGKVNADRATLQDIADTMMRCLEATIPINRR